MATFTNNTLVLLMCTLISLIIIVIVHINGYSKSVKSYCCVRQKIYKECFKHLWKNIKTLLMINEITLFLSIVFEYCFYFCINLYNIIL